MQIEGHGRLSQIFRQKTKPTMRICCSAAVLAAVLAPSDAFSPAMPGISAPLTYRSAHNTDNGGRSSVKKLHMSYLDDLSNNSGGSSSDGGPPTNWGAPPPAAAAPANPQPATEGNSNNGIFPGSIFDVISAECEGGAGPTERGSAAVYAYLEAVATRQAVPSPPASALIAKYIGSLSPDGMTPDSAVAIATYLESLSTGNVRLPSAQQFASYLNGIFMMDVKLPRSQDDLVSYFDGSAAPSTPPTDIAPYKEEKTSSDGPPPKVDVEEKAFPGAGGVWRTSSGKIVPPPAPAPKAPKEDLWKGEVLSEGNANVASEVKRIFFGGGLVFAGIAILAGTNTNVVQNAETEIVKDIDAIEQGAAKGVIKMEKEIVKDMKLSPELAAAAKRAVAQQEAAEKKMEQNQKLAEKKLIEEKEASRIAYEKAAPERAKAKAEAKAQAERDEDKKGEVESLGSDDFGVEDEEIIVTPEGKTRQLSPEEIANRKAARAAKAEEKRIARVEAERLAAERGEMEKDSADEYGSVADESSSTDAKKEITPEEVARRKAERAAKAEEKRAAEANVAPEKARAKAAAKADRMRREDERAALEAGAADEYGAIDEDKADASEARIDKAAAEAKARLDKAAALEKAKKEKAATTPVAAPAPVSAPAPAPVPATPPPRAQDTQAAEAKLKAEKEAAELKAKQEAEAKLQAEKEAATKVISMPEGVKDQLKGGSSKSSGASFTVYSTRL